MTAHRLLIDGPAAPSRLVAGFVGVLAACAGLPPRQAYRLRLATDEITTNIAVHGYRERGGPVDLRGRVEPELVRVCIEDEAPPFDPTGHDPAPRVTAGPTAALGGYGLFLALRSVDQFAYVHVGGRNRTTLCVRRCAAGR